MKVNFDVLRTDFKLILRKLVGKYDVQELCDEFNSHSSEKHDLKAPLDQAFRDVLLELLGNKPEVVLLQAYVTFSIEACRKGMIATTMPVVLLGDIFDAMTIDMCESMFEFVEKNVAIWKEELFFTSCKNNLLRMCNDLLRRLSRSQNTIFCGRILLFLAKFFPFSERSGLNIVSEFNLDNVTEFGSDSTSLKESITEIESAGDNQKLLIDYNLYCKFWALQDFFRNPVQCYNKLLWKTFTAHATNVLSAFSSCKLEDVPRKRIKTEDSDIEIAKDQKFHYFAKYLTNQKLLELQLSDSNFRRVVLIQFLILFQYLNSQVKFKSENCELKVDQVDWVKNMTDMVYKLLRETPPDGERYGDIIKHFLEREEHWNAWKNDGCPEFKKPLSADTQDEGTEKKRKPKRLKRSLGDLIKEASDSNRFYMGNPELTKLWNLNPDNLEACKAKERNFTPTLEEYFKEAIDEFDPAAMVEKEYRRVNDHNFGWRALRLLARQSPQFFMYTNNPNGKMPDYLESMIKKVAKDKLDRNNPPEQTDGQNEGEMELDLLKGSGDVQNEEKTEPENENGNIQKAGAHVKPEQLDLLCLKIGSDWKNLAPKLGYNSGEIKYFESEGDTDLLRVKNMLKVWFEDDEDATLENLCYTLEGLGLIEASNFVKNDMLGSQ